VVTYPPGAQKCTGSTSLIPYIYFIPLSLSRTRDAAQRGWLVTSRVEAQDYEARLVT